MTESAVTLREATDWVRLRILADGHAEVLEGTLFVPGDVVARPGRLAPWLSWHEAALEGRDGNTLLGPFELDLYFDSVTGWYCLPLEREDAPRDAARHVEDLSAAVISDAVDLVSDEADEMAREILAVLQEPARDNGERRRGSDMAA